jgi:hypothetical protein
MRLLREVPFGGSPVDTFRNGRGRGRKSRSLAGVARAAVHRERRDEEPNASADDAAHDRAGDRRPIASVHLWTRYRAQARGLSTPQAVPVRRGAGRPGFGHRSGTAP